jgi:hypothetical protein
MIMPLHGKEQHPAHSGIHSYGLSCLLSRKEPLPHEELRRFAGALMTAVSRACYARNAGDVGHVKAYIESEDGFLLADTVGDPSEVTVTGKESGPADHFRLVLNAVVYGLGKGGVKEAAEEALGTISLAFGLSIERTDRENAGDNRT